MCKSECATFFLCVSLIYAEPQSMLSQQREEATSGISDGSCIISNHKDEMGACTLVAWSAAVCHLFF